MLQQLGALLRVLTLFVAQLMSAGREIRTQTLMNQITLMMSAASGFTTQETRIFTSGDLKIVAFLF